jgi:hypothetical protein
MEWLLPERGRNFPAFIAGTEATLGIVTRATVQLANSVRIVARLASVRSTRRWVNGTAKSPRRRVVT